MCLVLVSPCRYLACLVPGGSNFGGLLTTTAARPVQCQAAGRGSITESIFIGKGQQPAAKQSPTRDPDTGRGEQRAGTKIFTARSGSVFSLKSIKNE